MKKQIGALIVGFLMTACSGGGGGSGSSPSGSVPEVFKKPKLNCGSKDCISGGSVSSFAMKASNKAYQSVSPLSVGNYTFFKTSADNTKTRLNDIADTVHILNLISADEDITDCSSLPVSGTYNHNGVYDLTFAVGGESWNIGNGLTVMTHEITMDSTAQTSRISFKCDTLVQSLHIITKTKGGSPIHYESFSQINTMTKEITLQVAMLSSTANEMAYFHSDGNDEFNMAVFTSDGGATHQSVIAKSYKDSTFDLSATRVEYAYSTTGGVDLDTINFDGSGNARGCVSDYRTSPSVSAGSCDPNGDPMNPVKYALTTDLGAILLGDATTWDTDALNAMTIIDP